MRLDLFGHDVCLAIEIYGWRFGIGEEHLLGEEPCTAIFVGPTYLETGLPAWAVLAIMLVAAVFVVHAIAHFGQQRQGTR